MDTNGVADAVLNYLLTKHPRVYRNIAEQSPVFPYVVFKIDTITNTYPSFDMYLVVNIYDEPGASVRTIEALGDSIDFGLEQKVINGTDMSLRFGLEQRQYVSSEDLIDAQLVNFRYVIRGYFS